MVSPSEPPEQLFQITKIQILKVIHNRPIKTGEVFIVVSNHKDTNFESNSQQDEGLNVLNACCFKSQRYKF